MPAKFFICPDRQTIPITDCLKLSGCRMKERCATIPYLKAISFDREYRGVSPSMAGNSARLIYLRAITDYAIDPMDRTWSILGIAVHEKLSALRYVTNVLSEEKLSNEQMEGTADLLEIDEENQRFHLLTDYKTYGSYKVAKCLGLKQEQKPLLNEDGSPILLKSGKNKGKPKTESVTKCDPEKADLKFEILQVNRYRIFFENSGFPISRMRLQVMVRDGGLYVAKGRGITQNLYLIPIPRMDDVEVLYFYDELQRSVDEAFANDWAPRCTAEENWDGRRCDGFCEVSEACRLMDRGVWHERNF
jgi:hypothetical protein